MGGILDGFAVGGPVDNEADVAAPVCVVGVERDILAHESEVGAGAAGEFEQAIAPPLFAGDFGAALREDGVKPVLEAERQVQAQRDDEAGVAHEAEDACYCSGMVTDCLAVGWGQEIDKQI